MVVGWWAEALALAALIGVLGFAMVQPRGLPEAAAAVPAAALLIGLGVVGPAAALEQLRLLGPTVGFLAAILVLAHLADTEGVFTWLGARLGTASRGRPRRLLGLVFVVAALTTAVLSLDATVVLLTPVVFATAAGVRVRAKPHVYACTHLANSASLLLPVSNLTNLLAFAASGLSFAGFAALMGVPWLVAIGVEYLVFLRFFRPDLAGADRRRARSTPEVGTPTAHGPVPVFAFVVLGLALVGFGLSGLVGVEPVWVAVAAAAVLAAPAVARRRIGPVALVRSAAPLFCLFVLALGVVVAAVSAHGVGTAVAALIPAGQSLPQLLGVAAVAAVLANVVNNLPATLLLLGALAHAGPPPVAGSQAGLVLAVLIGVNIGPNLTYVGSLATLLWRRVLAGRDAAPDLGEFLRLGALTVPLGLVAAVTTLWLGLCIDQGRLL